jgi:NAD(P)-dependent dehydrogenase (short-subunit alcohol dehydrogenase family)
MAPAQTDPNAAVESSSQPPSSGCCDDHLSPLSAQRGRANFAGFAPTKAAQRILAEAMARDLGPKGVHVAYIVIDAVIDVPWARERFKTKPDDFFIAPAAIADEAWHVASQPRSAWSFNVEVRPYGETW